MAPSSHQGTAIVTAREVGRQDRGKKQDLTLRCRGLNAMSARAEDAG
jgi:hypothetical protein